MAEEAHAYSSAFVNGPKRGGLRDKCIEEEGGETTSSKSKHWLADDGDAVGDGVILTGGVRLAERDQRTK